MSQKIKETEKIKASLKDDLFNYYLMSKDYNDLKIQY